MSRLGGAILVTIAPFLSCSQDSESTIMAMKVSRPTVLICFNCKNLVRRNKGLQKVHQREGVLAVVLIV